MELTIRIEGLQGIATAITQMALAMTGGKVEAVKADAAAIEEKPKEKIGNQEKKETKQKETPKEDVNEETREAVKEEPGQEETAEEITLEMLRAKGAELSRAGKQAELKAAISECGAAKLSEIKKDKYAQLYKLMEGI